VHRIVNAYYLQEEATRALRRGEAPHTVDEVLRKARALGATVVRTNAYNAAHEKRGDSAIRWSPEETDELAFRGLDLVLQRAVHHDLRLVLVLGNQWDELGGARTYVTWANLPSPKSADARFFTDARVNAIYEKHVDETLQRISTVDGLRYGAHPAVAGWEVLNEPRGQGLERSGHTMRDWIDRIARRVRYQVEGGAWVGSGEEGFDVSLEGRSKMFWLTSGASWIFRTRCSFALNARSPFLNVASVHLYPEDWGVRTSLIEEAGTRMLRESAALARAHNKPLFVGEMGVRNDGKIPLQARRNIIRAWLRVAEEEGAWGAGAWMLSYDARPMHWDAYQFYVRNGLPLEAAENGIASAYR
jgi:mannan endo-1,4-beta-mannosidase